MKFDRYYTPAEACSAAYSAWVSNPAPIRIADFCCGDGILLRLAPFSEKVVFGLDIDEDIVRSLSNEYPSWDIRTGDFLRPSEHIDTFLKDLYGSLDLVVLNPPFSYRGMQREYVNVDGVLVGCTRPMAFFYKCFDFLKPSGSMMAILPRSIFRSDNDKILLAHIRKYWDVEIDREFPRTTFQGCRPHAVSVSVKRKFAVVRGVEGTFLPPIHEQAGGKLVNLVRGCVQMHTTTDSGKFRVLHTRNLRNLIPTQGINKYTERQGRTVSGEVILFPRVGLPDLQKVRFINIEEDLTLSDCVFGLAAETSEKTAGLYSSIVEHWELFERLYPSTCAPYITVEQLKGQLLSLGWNAQVVNCIKGVERHAVPFITDLATAGICPLPKVTGS